MIFQIWEDNQNDWLKKLAKDARDGKLPIQQSKEKG